MSAKSDAKRAKLAQFQKARAEHERVEFLAMALQAPPFTQKEPALIGPHKRRTRPLEAPRKRKGRKGHKGRGR